MLLTTTMLELNISVLQRILFNCEATVLLDNASENVHYSLHSVLVFIMKTICVPLTVSLLFVPSIVRPQ